MQFNLSSILTRMGKYNLGRSYIFGRLIYIEFLSSISAHRGNLLKHVTGAIYLSLGIILLSFENFEGYYSSFIWVSWLSILTGLLFSFSAFKDYWNTPNKRTNEKNSEKSGMLIVLKFLIIMPVLK